MISAHEGHVGFVHRPRVNRIRHEAGISLVKGSLFVGRLVVDDFQVDVGVSTRTVEDFHDVVVRIMGSFGVGGTYFHVEVDGVVRPHVFFGGRERVRVSGPEDKASVRIIFGEDSIVFSGKDVLVDRYLLQCMVTRWRLGKEWDGVLVVGWCGAVGCHFGDGEVLARSGGDGLFLVLETRAGAEMVGFIDGVEDAWTCRGGDGP